MRFALCIVDLVWGFVTVKQASCRYLERLLVMAPSRFASFRVLCNAGDPNCALSYSHRWAVVKRRVHIQLQSLCKETPGLRELYAL